MIYNQALVEMFCRAMIDTARGKIDILAVWGLIIKPEKVARPLMVHG
jgi:hypothetical protein